MTVIPFVDVLMPRVSTWLHYAVPKFADWNDGQTIPNIAPLSAWRMQLVVWEGIENQDVILLDIGTATGEITYYDYDGVTSVGAQIYVPNSRLLPIPVGEHSFRWRGFKSTEIKEIAHGRWTLYPGFA